MMGQVRYALSGRHARAMVLAVFGGCLYVAACGDSGDSDPSASDAGDEGLPIKEPPPIGHDAGLVRPLVVAGQAHVCAILEDDSLRCWGRNAGGQLGNPQVVVQSDGGYTFDTTTVARPAPAAVGNVVSVAPSTGTSAAIDQYQFGTTCAILLDGHVQCWGDDTLGALGRGDASANVSLRPHPEPFAVIDLPISDQIATNGRLSCSVGGGHVRCWGENDLGIMLPGIGPTEQRSPVDIVLPEGRTAKQISLGRIHACVLLDDGGVACWGGNYSGQLGYQNPDGSHENSMPTIVSSLLSIMEIQASGETTCAREQFGRVFCFGSSQNGALLGRGPADAGNDYSPAEIVLPPESFVTQLSMGYDHACVLLRDGAVWCWGENALGALGDAVVPRSGTPLKVELSEPAISVAAGENFTCAVLNNRRVVCWGSNVDGALGQGAVDVSPHPVPMPVIL